MGRGKPFAKSLKRLVAAGVVARPVWMDIVEGTRPPFQPVSVTKSPYIEYSEDRLRRIFFQRNPTLRRISTALKARSIADRHVADRFVAIQMKLMKEDNLSEHDAYEGAEKILKSYMRQTVEFGSFELRPSLSDQNVTDEAALLYLASVQDSRKDQALYRALQRQSKVE